MKILITVPVYPTESREKVKKAVENIFPGVELTESPTDDYVVLEGAAPSLDRFAELLAKQKIRDAARAHLLSRLKGDRLSLSLNKQAAFVGRVNFVEGSVPLGSLDVTLAGEEDELRRTVEIITRIPPAVVGGGGE